MRRSPHPVLRRLSVNGGAASVTIERLRSSEALLPDLGRSFQHLEWIFGSSLDGLLRSLDLSGLRRSVDAVNERVKRSAEAPASSPLRQHRNRIGTAHSIATPPADRFKRNAAEITTLLHAYSAGDHQRTLASLDPRGTGFRTSRAGAESAGVPNEQSPTTNAIAEQSTRSNIVAPPQSSAADERESSGMRLVHRDDTNGAASGIAELSINSRGGRISRAQATEWFRSNAVRAGASAIADTPIVRSSSSGAAEILQQLVAETHEARHHPVTPGPRMGDAIAQISHAVEVLREAPRQRRGRLAKREAVIRHDHLRGYSPENGNAAQFRSNALDASPKEQGLRGLVARALSSSEELTFEQPKPREPSESLAQQLDALLRAEARRQGIDLEEVER